MQEVKDGKIMKKKAGRPTDKRKDRIYKKTTIRIDQDILHEMRRFPIGHDKYKSMDSFMELAVRAKLRKLGVDVPKK